MRSVLILTGSPAVGKTTCARRLAEQRFDTRPRHLTDEEFIHLWRTDSRTRLPGALDVVVDGIGIDEQVDAIDHLWATHPPVR